MKCKVLKTLPPTHGFSYLNGVLPLGEVDLALPLFLGGPGGLVLGETAAQLTGELGAEVEREVLLVLVEQTQLSALVGVDNGEDTSNRLANVAAVQSKSVFWYLYGICMTWVIFERCAAICCRRGLRCR